MLGPMSIVLLVVEMVVLVMVGAVVVRAGMRSAGPMRMLQCGHCKSVEPPGYILSEEEEQCQKGSCQPSRKAGGA